MTGRIDVHSHLLPTVDDGCTSLEESIACARLMVAAGYTHQFCTPHFWPSFPENSVTNIPAWVDRLQMQLDAAHVELKLLPGGEINLRPDLMSVAPERVVSYCMARKYCLVDIWADELPKFFFEAVRWLQSLGMTVILAHPERMKAVQSKPSLADRFSDLGLLLQGNLQCFGRSPRSPTRDTAERYLAEGRYFMVGSDLHNERTMAVRLNGLERVGEAVGESALKVLTVTNPSQLLPPPATVSPAPHPVRRIASHMSTIELPHTSGCLVCGQANPHGLHLRLFVDPASGVVTTDFTPRAEHIGFEGIVHGGIVATVIDEAMVWAATWSGRRFCVCGEMSVRFRQSVEVGKTVRVTARVDSSRARLITTEADVRCGETTHALATGKYVPLPEAHSARFITTLVPEKSTEAAAQFLRGATT